VSVQRLAADLGIRRLLAEYCHRVDDRDFDGWADLYAEDATLVPNDAPVAGREAVRAWAHERFADPTVVAKHLIANPIIDVDVTGQRGSVRSDFTVVMRVGGAYPTVLAGRYVSEVVLVGSVWRFARHEIVVPAEWMPSPTR
jgi:ketosteroid isomerase-like protein